MRTACCNKMFRRHFQCWHTYKCCSLVYFYHWSISIFLFNWHIPWLRVYNSPLGPFCDLSWVTVACSCKYFTPSRTADELHTKHLGQKIVQTSAQYETPKEMHSVLAFLPLMAQTEYLNSRSELLLCNIIIMYKNTGV